MPDSQETHKESKFNKYQPVLIVISLLGAVACSVFALFFNGIGGFELEAWLLCTGYFLAAFIFLLLTNKGVIEYIARYWQPAVRGIVLTLLLATLFFFGFKPIPIDNEKDSISNRLLYANCLASYEKSLRRYEYAKHNLEQANDNRSVTQDEFGAYLASHYSRFDDATTELKTKEAEKEIAQKKYQMEVYLSVLIRAICLGALGAIASMLARQVIEQNESSFFGKPKFWDTLITNSLLGAIVSVVVICLFFTKQLTIFKPDISKIEPDYWRITLVCILAGAFSKKIYSYIESGLNRFGPTGNQPQN